MDFSEFSKAEPTLPSDSESDEDYMPGGDSDLPSEEESGKEISSSSSSEDESESRKKRKRPQRPAKKKARRKGRNRKEEASEDASEEKETETEEQKALTEEEEKKRADSLWADFKKEAESSSPKLVPKTAKTNGNAGEAKEATKEVEKKGEKENKVKITKIFEFAGEEVKVEKEVDANSAEAQASSSPFSKGTVAGSAAGSSTNRGRGRGRSSGGISSVLGQLGKKTKIGTLEKSKLDWDRFKKTEGIEDDLRNFNRGKDGFLEKQDFLQRADLRQFEIEKGMRASRRSNR